jgi:hypothetical protein
MRTGKGKIALILVLHVFFFISFAQAEAGDTKLTATSHRKAEMV